MSMLPSPFPVPNLIMASEGGADVPGKPLQPAPHPAHQRDDSIPAVPSPPGRGRFTRDEILAILGEQASGTPIVELCRRYGVSTTTFFRWRKRYEPAAPNATRAEQSHIRQIEEENRQLKKLLAEAMLENAMIRESAGLGSLFGKK